MLWPNTLSIWTLIYVLFMRLLFFFLYFCPLNWLRFEQWNCFNDIVSPTWSNLFRSDLNSKWSLTRTYSILSIQFIVDSHSICFIVKLKQYVGRCAWYFGHWAGQYARNYQGLVPRHKEAQFRAVSKTKTHTRAHTITKCSLAAQNMPQGVPRECIARSSRCFTQTRRMHHHCYQRTRHWASVLATNRTRPAWAWKRCANGNGRRFRILRAMMRPYFIIGNVSAMIPRTIHLPSSINNWRYPATQWQSIMHICAIIYKTGARCKQIIYLI